MPPKACSCKKHGQYLELSEESDPTIFRTDGKKVRTAALQFLISIGALSERAKFICNACVSFAEQNLTEIPPKKRKEFDIADSFEDIINNIHQLSAEKQQKLAFEIGKLQRLEILKDASDCGDMYKNQEFLCTYKIQDWISQRNQVVVKFLEGLSETDAKTRLPFVKALDQIYCLCSSKFVSPLAFSQNILSYLVTGSKTALNIMNPGTPAGGYSTVLKWMSRQADVPNKCPSHKDIVTFFDNNQVLERKWHVKSNFKSKPSVMTNIIHILSNSDNIQNNPACNPKHWMKFDIATLKTTLRKVLDNVEVKNILFRQYRNHFIASRINKVMLEQKKVDCGHKDIVDDAVAFVDLGTKIPEHTQANARYTFVESRHSAKPTEVVIGEPCFENPCSFESVQKVFDHILQETGTGQTREWTVMGCDALPYVIGNKIIQNTHICPCKLEFDCVRDFEEHRREFGHVDKPIETCRKYNNILLMPGLGHYEINATKAIFKLLWNVCIVDLAKMLGYQSVKALATCEGATDHHKSWQILEILLHSMVDELLVPYCRSTLTDGVTPSVGGYYEWVLAVTDPCYKFMMDTMFNYCFGLHLFRAGVRRNNSCAIECSKNKIATLFFGLNMPFYMETYIRDSLVRSQCPQPVRSFIEDNESYSISGNPAKGEGGDFVLENVNRKTKKAIPPGVPDERRWTVACRNLDKIHQIKENIYPAINLSNDEEDYLFSYDISQEIFDFRTVIRKKQYLSSPFSENEQHVSLSGNPLDKDLVNVVDFCASNFEQCIDDFINSGLGCRPKVTQISVTVSDKETKDSIEHKTIKEIKQIVEGKLTEMKDSKLDGRWKSIKKAKKSIIIDFLSELKLKRGTDNDG